MSQGGKRMFEILLLMSVVVAMFFAIKLFLRRMPSHASQVVQKPIQRKVLIIPSAYETASSVRRFRHAAALYLLYSKRELKRPFR
jgi:hypothetical protein